jgi:nicotinamide riboside kinase
VKVAILGAECTGKTTLAAQLVTSLGLSGQSVLAVGEVLREWCAEHGRTPQAHEQMAIAQAQAQRVLDAGACDVLLADTTPLMTAVYSDVLLGDPSLYPFALAHHAVYDLTLVMGLDLPWIANGIQRDGPLLQAQVDTRLRAVLQDYGLRFSVVYGQNTCRCESALQAIEQANAHVLRNPNPSSQGQTRWKWVCEKCSDAQCEHQLFTALLPATGT